MEHISNPALRVILKVAGNFVPDGKDPCQWAWEQYEETGNVSYLAIFEKFAQQSQLTEGARASYQAKINAAKEAGVLSEDIGEKVYGVR